MLLTWNLLLVGSRPNLLIALTTRCSRTESMPSGKVGSEMNAADCSGCPGISRWLPRSRRGDVRLLQLEPRRAAPGSAGGASGGQHRDRDGRRY
jgi:hypothetical protein